MVVIDLDETMVTKSRYPIRAVIESVNRLACRVFVLTGREEAQREQTLKDLDFARIVYDELSLMPTVDMDIAEYKRATVERLLVDYDVLAFVDDNDDNRAAVESLDVYVMTPDEFVDAAVNSGLFAENEDLIGYETREVSRVAPSFMAASARRGLRLHEEGESGDGLMPATVADARRMVNGEPLSVDKWRRIPGWIARHMMDLDAVDGDEITPGLVAMLLWGGGSSKSSARRTQDYAERMVERLAADEQRAPAPKKDQIKGSDTNPAGSAADKTGDITLSESTDKALQNKADEHNADMAANDRPNWTRVRVGTLRSVYRRGSGAYSSSHRPGIGRAQWSMARVNAFLHLVRTGKPENPKYVTDNDLLHADHPRRTDGEDRAQPRKPNGQFGSGGGGDTSMWWDSR